MRRIFQFDISMSKGQRSYANKIICKGSKIYEVKCYKTYKIHTSLVNKNLTGAGPNHDREKYLRKYFFPDRLTPSIHLFLLYYL